MDEDSRITIEYLRGLPEGAVVRWSTHHLSAEEPWTSRWVDVRIEDENGPPFGWVWTILGEDDPDGASPDQLWDFVWPYDLVLLGGWSAGAIGAAIAHWTATHAGRPDLRFEWDPDAEPPPAVARAAERAREIEEGAPTWDLGEGLVVADGLMDDLLAMDPDERDELMKAFRELG